MRSSPIYVRASMTVGVRYSRGSSARGALPALVAECDRVQAWGHRNFNRTNPYFTQDHPDLPLSHPLRRFYDRSNAFVPADHFGADSGVRAIYEWQPFAPFIQAALQEASFYRYGDPLADVDRELGGGRQRLPVAL
jgi:hypothetical protein